MTDILDCCLVIYVIYVFKQNVHFKKINKKLRKIKTPCKQPPSEAHLKVDLILLLFFCNHTCICTDKKASVLNFFLLFRNVLISKKSRSPSYDQVHMRSPSNSLRLVTSGCEHQPFGT